jgi:hypothetical protein
MESTQVKKENWEEIQLPSFFMFIAFIYLFMYKFEYESFDVFYIISIIYIW